ncbi:MULTISPECIES: DUF503 domain-containing protein [Pseudothermotoga]|jgi:hypothetical protein|uniref:DUF503 domain-containing protein n=1 Tax=Pseudothermotoga lettingae (strain ATCC BAA-301 / DSM 14385 / NBRC 107922 / TMO) TaxID=416591 RepID=A8F5X3_PSELT|nr:MULTISPECIES: DUF503 domain-containing protein [Pseudothermotoga]ABV33557.1 protein of unknown function DUF503 [Pseudothermotoga lettingae TMO]KUK20787.1 MAG: Uncharacterized protein XD56_1308 [Pseudothermotoga lettingae]MDI3495560.1 uncharacterized protein [Pseudothermotoga sp.]MDK2883795.1 uncharacterized protein [Pseudothermotoga sp.]GLI49529.1 hypothetical protein PLETTINGATMO_16980 [Pseudothermotoga lettingae TMO]
MHVAVLSYKLRLFGIASLKEKRSLLKKLINEIRAKFNVSACEIGYSDSKTWSELGVAIVSSSQSILDAVVEDITALIENTMGLEIVEIEREGW